MVSVRKSNQSTFKLRRKGRRPTFDAETVGLVTAGLCIGFLVVFLYSLAFSEDSVGEGGDGMYNAKPTLPESVRRTNKHPNLMEEFVEGDEKGGNEMSGETIYADHPPIKHVRPMGDGMNAIAEDIAKYLNCDSLLKDAEEQMKKYSNAADDAMDNLGANDYLEVHRRRLQQHGDDGGFGNWEDHEGDAARKQDDGIGNWGDAGGDIPKKREENTEMDDGEIRNEHWGETVNDDRIPDSELEGENGEENVMDWGGENYVELTAKHLFCMAASEKTPKTIADDIRCDASASKRKTLLELWSAARAQMSLDLLLKVLDLAQERPELIQGRTYNLWIPVNDEGSQYVLNTLNNEDHVDRGGLNGLDENLGPGKLFVDVGSCLGLTSLVINQKYPGTKIVSIEPAQPNWLLQEMNMRCNLPSDDFKNMKIMLAGVGANTEEEDYTMAKLMWRPTSTTSSRSWTPVSELQDEDVEIVVSLRRMSSILAEAGVSVASNIDVLNMDCQGCEYNMIPALTDKEFEEIPTIMGGVHWGYINPNVMPSSKRGKITHQRLCKHENIARGTKECCAFPDMPVKSSKPGEVLERHGSKEFPPHQSTVSDVIADGLCDNFDNWAKDVYLYEIPDDFNWFQLSSHA